MKKIAAVLLAVATQASGLLFLASVPAAAAAPAAEKTYISAFKNTITLKGTFGGNEYYFTVDKHWKLHKATLHLDFDQSQQIDTTDLSTMTILLNNVPIHTIPLKKYFGKRAVLDINLDLRKVKTGTNSVKVQAYRRASSLPCVDNVSDANWINIYGSSAVNLQYNDIAPTKKLSEFPYPFYRMQQDSDLKTAVAVGSSPSAQEYASALEMTAVFGQYAGSNDAAILTKPLADISDKDTRDIIYVGNSTHAPAEIRSLFPAKTDFSSGAWFRVAASPYNSGHTILAILADKDSNLQRAVQFLRNSQLTAQVDSDTYHLDSGRNVLTKDTAAGNDYTFSALGYPGTYLYGAFRKTATMSIKLPADRVLSSASNITLHFRYSKNLDFNRSLVSIYINNTPIGSKKLTDANAGNDTLSISFPKDVCNGHYFELKIAFDLEIQDMWCTKRQEEMPWAYLIGDSSLHLPTTQTPLNLFSNLPSPFVSGNKWNNTAFVLPQMLQADDLNAAGQVAMQLGRNVTSNHTFLKVVENGEDANSLASSNMIVIGSPQRQPILAKHPTSLYFQYNDQQSYFLSNEKMELLPEKSQTLTSFQLVDSPYNAKCVMLALTGPKESSLRSLVSAFFCPSTIGKLAGDGILIEPSGTVHDFRFKASPAAAPNFWNGAVSDTSTLVFFIIAGFVLLMIIVVLVLLRQKKKQRDILFEQHKENSKQDTPANKS